MKLNYNPKLPTVYTIVVSDIRTRINANISDVVQDFKDAGVSLADRSLGTGGDERVDFLSFFSWLCSLATFALL